MALRRFFAPSLVLKLSLGPKKAKRSDKPLGFDRSLLVDVSLSWNFFGVKEFFFMNFDFKNRCKNEFKDNNEKSCSWSRNRVSHKIDFKALWPRNGKADSVGVKSFLKNKFFHCVNFFLNCLEDTLYIFISDNGLKRLIILDQSSISKILTPEVTCFAVWMNRG